MALFAGISSAKADVAAIGTTTYAKLSLAIEAASDEGQTTIVLISNVKENVTIPIYNIQLLKILFLI